MTDPQTLGPGALIMLKLIDQLPAILGALGLLVTALVGVLNFRRLGEVKTQNDGHMSALLQKQNEMATQLALSVPAAALTAVVAAGAASAHASATAADRAAEHAKGLVDARTPPATTDAITHALDNIDANTANIDKNTKQKGDA